MKKLQLILGLALGFLWTGFAFGDGIYTWTDNQGVRHFSDKPPEETVQQVSVIRPVEPPASADAEPANQRPAFEQMVRQAEQERIRLESERLKRESQEAEKQKQEVERRRQAERQAQRDHLQKQIDAIRNRALGPNYTQGMKDNQIRELEEKMDALEASER